ncbi:hypothetical protein JK628_14675 [Shewanella sp. KX20019]|uniref:DUF6488 family protein n=1 Tax=Shewanella sp. KX20019 TaxID=2803864 RepID=UPI001927DF71|nr:DUF6488 family protein [Shewanella sp. KX20019]QQX78807.1 hypothetical protein JK628_14675 [Shewanella sp. KX20019]
MKKLSIIICAALVSLSSQAFAHGDGHSVMEADAAVKLAQTSAKMLSFKDHGMSVGKIDDSWSQVAKSEFVLSEQAKDGFIIKGYNAKIGQTLYFTIDKSGQVKTVEESKKFNKSHGHAH